jgi:hypothetical protein
LNVSLIRFGGKGETIGALIIDGDPVCLTLELPWKNNAQNVSRIPAGIYECKRVYDRTTGGGSYIPETFEITGVPGRSGILFHVGNSIKDTQGCVLTGMALGGADRAGWILNSKDAFGEFLRATSLENAFKLTIIDPISN